MKQLTVLSGGILACTIAFALTLVSFHADFSLLALPIIVLYCAVLVYVLFFLLLKHQSARILPSLRRLLQYYPFVLLAAFVFRRAGKMATSHLTDLFSIWFWLLGTVLSIVLLYFLNEKRVFAQNPELARSFESLPKPIRKGIRRVIFEIFDWIDAFVQAAFTVALINIFILQLYAIPSESMVSEFLIGDRVIVLKTPSGPEFPLSSVSIPQMRSYKRGDIVVFSNPHYNSDRSSQIRTFVAQLVYMLTFTGVNLNVDEFGNLKADPLVKRVTGVPGEQLVMLDGVLYRRTAAKNTFEPVTADAEWALWNANELPQNLRRNVQDIPLTQADYEALLSVEKMRRDLDFTAAASQAVELAQRFETLKRRFGILERSVAGKNYESLFSQKDLFEYSLFANNDDITRRLLSVDGGSQWFTAFMTEWTSSIPQNTDMYEDALYRMNVLVKLTAGSLIVRNTELLLANVSAVEQQRDAQKIALLTDAKALNTAIMFNDRRNMPVFPPNAADGAPSYIPEKHYFMMGDNRFNSLDMRHSYDTWLMPLTKHDAYSATYYSNLAPQIISTRDMLGTTVLRFWPLNRIGMPD